MGGYFGSIKVEEGICTITDSSIEKNRNTGTFKINDDCLAIIVLGYPEAINFCDKYLKKHNTEKDVEKILRGATDDFLKDYSEYKGKPFSIAITSFIRPYVPFYYGIWINENGLRAEELTLACIFSLPHQDLGEYLTEKVFSKHMSLDEASELLTYVSQQCLDIIPTSTSLEMTLLTKKGIKKLNDEELHEKFQKAEKTDQKMKMIFSDFFIDIGDAK